MSEENDKPATALRPLSAEAALSSGEEWSREVGRWHAMIRSGAMPKHIRTPEMAIAICRIGDLYGWDPMRSLRSIYLVDGRPEMSAESMLALIREKCPDAAVYPVESTDKVCRIKVLRPPQIPEPIIVEVTIGQFRHLSNKDNWRNYGADMLWCRGVSRVARRCFPDVIAGAYTLGELGESSSTVRQAGPQPMSFEDKPEPIEAEVVEVDPDAEPKLVEDEPWDPETGEFADL